MREQYSPIVRRRAGLYMNRGKMQLNWGLLTFGMLRLVKSMRNRNRDHREKRELEAAVLAARRSLWAMQGRGEFPADINLLARDLPFLQAKTVNGKPEVLMHVSVATIPELAGGQRRDFASVN